MNRKNNNLISILALILALAALALSALNLASQPEDQTHLIDDLYEENRQLYLQVKDLEDLMQQLLTVSNLDTWTLGVEPWADSTGAEVTFTAVPTNYQPGVSATFLVQLDGQRIREVPCQWNGAQFTAAVSLDAADGYSYYCLLDSPGGNQLLTLATPDDPTSMEAVYMHSSLSAYCNLVITDWIETPGTSLTLTDAYAQVQLPRISTEGTVQILTTEVVLRLNGTESTRIPIKLAPSEVAGSFDLTITSLHIPMPALTDTDVLELSLEVVLSDGRRLSALGVTWYLDNGKLTSSVG